MLMRLFIARPLPEPVLDAARAAFEVTIRPSNAPLSEAEMVAALSDYDVILPTLGDRFQAGIFAQVPTPRARLLANFGVGYNHIDVAAAKAAGLVVTNTPGAVTDATADIALTLMLMSARRAGEGERLVRSGRWEGWHPTQMLGLHLSGKRLGVIGMGRIGQAIARRALHGFGMKIAYFTRSPKDLPDLPGAEGVTSLTGLMAQSDVVVVALPATPATHHLIDAEALAAMQPHAHLVNIARGDIVDEAALIAALAEGRIAGAGLDVYEFEPRVPEALRAMENVVLLPHLGTAALEVRTEMGLMAVANAIAFKEGRALPNAV
ncbi:D-glycerate dehydrogenase [Pararhodobacter aggregans]